MIPTTFINFDTFVQDCRDGGFSPAQALMFYDELKRFAPPCITPVDDVAPEAASWRALRNHALAGGLLEVKTLQDFEKYRRHWIGARETLESAGTPILYEDESHVLALYRYVARDEWLDRLSGIVAFRQPPAWKAWEEMGAEWKDVQGALDVERLHLPALEDALPAGLTEEQAFAALDEVVSRIGLAGVKWPLVSHSAATMWTLAQQIQHCAQELADQTGSTPSVLGLGQRIELNVGGEDKYGGTADHRPDFSRSQLLTSNLNPWGMLAHEWLHALDSFLNKEPGKVSLSRTKGQKAWSEILSVFEQPVVADSNHQSVLERLLEKGWGDCPTVQGLLERITDPSCWTSQEKIQMLAAIRKDKGAELGVDDELAQMRAIVGLTDLQMIQMGLASSTSAWNHFGQQVGVNAADLLNLDNKEEVLYWSEYFSSSDEKCAYSFEAAFPPGALSSDASALPSYRYPHGAERDQHVLGWKRFFRAAKPWINELCQSPPELKQGIEPEEKRLAARV